MSSATVFPRGIGPGLLPTSTEIAFSSCAICCSIAGICADAVSYCDCACATFICETCPYSNW